ncbi:hypothetical protein BH772_gp040 [Gordonia phage Bachita]|uniref:Uncharacterized protein n=1 Tax=Gordonia phage Bachita TaxID=1838061 RepID=A0A160DFV4_9CAUD|nr:hypothetical protein BH772_gp040 [Gordonia phage Bachita]ANA86845.1 hypothetical protein PBI_BACHITA_171 [Gordonia phage Bachita]QKY79744.1 hypothetical protein SEA_ENGINEER_170 [Gordonia Phage Engineer]
MTHKVAQLDTTDLTLMHRGLNREMMVAFINADLIERANLDVRHSIVLYDEDRDFRYAVPEMLDDDTMARLYGAAGIRYWSKGI